LLDAQVARLSTVEQTVLDWLAVEREPIDFGTLVADLGPDTPRGAVLEALEVLGRRSLLERGDQGATFTLQPVVLEHATGRLIATAAEEIVRRAPSFLVPHPLITAPTQHYV